MLYVRAGAETSELRLDRAAEAERTVGRERRKVEHTVAELRVQLLGANAEAILLAIAERRLALRGNIRRVVDERLRAGKQALARDHRRRNADTTLHRAKR